MKTNLFRISCWALLGFSCGNLCAETNLSKVEVDEVQEVVALGEPGAEVIAPKQITDLSQLESKKFYIFKSVTTGGLAYVKEDGHVFWSKDMSSKDGCALWQMQQDKQKRWSAKSLQFGQFMPAYAADVSSSLSKPAKYMTFEALGDNQFKVILAKDKKTSTYMSASADQLVIDADGGKNSSSAWYIFEVDPHGVHYSVTIDEYDYATLFLPYAVSIPEGVTIYSVIGTKSEGGKQILDLYHFPSLVAGVDLAPYRPVILHADVASGTKTFDFQYSTGGYGTGELPNLLKGTQYTQYVAPEPGQDPYILTLNGNDVVMQKVLLNYDNQGNKKENGGCFLNHANKAYLQLPASATANMFRLDLGDVTGIQQNEVNDSSTDSSVYYDLSGRRLEKVPTKGFYILNGKKYYVK